MLTLCQRDRGRRTGWAGPGRSEGGRVGHGVTPDATFAVPPPSGSPFSVLNVSKRDSGERGCSALRKAGGTAQSGWPPLPGGRTRLHTRGWKAAPSPPPLHCADLGWGCRVSPPLFSPPPRGTLLRDGPELAVGGAGEKGLAGSREGAGAKGRGEWSAGRGVGVGWSRDWEEPAHT